MKKNKRNYKYGLVIIILLGVISFISNIEDMKVDSTKDNALFDVFQEDNEITLEQVILKRVVDGDTLIVTNADDEDLRVRLIGIDTPESVNPDSSKNTIEGELASEYTKSLLTIGQNLYLEYDVEQFDVYDRTLAYVWLTDDVNSSDITSISTNMLNAKLVADGYAVAKEYKPNVKYSSILKILEK